MDGVIAAYFHGLTDQYTIPATDRMPLFMLSVDGMSNMTGKPAGVIPTGRSMYGYTPPPTICNDWRISSYGGDVYSCRNYMVVTSLQT